MGPLVTAAHRDTVKGYIDAGAAAGATLVVDGRGLDGAGLRARLLPRPDAVRSRDAGDDDLHGRDLRPGARRAARRHARRGDRARQPQSRTATARRSSPARAARRGGSRTRSKSGWSASTSPIPVPMAFFSFGGWKQSLFGDLHVYGMEGITFYTRTKAITTRWPARDAVSAGLPHADDGVSRGAEASAPRSWPDDLSAAGASR